MTTAHVYQLYLRADLDEVWRAEKANASYTAALEFDWKRCADETFGFLARVAEKYRECPAPCAAS